MKYLKLFEDYGNEELYYHGTRTLLPFNNFDKKMDGSGLVSMGRKYGGFFFTSSEKNANSYSETWRATVKINNVVKSSDRDIKKSLENANDDSKNYVIEDVLDGAVLSDIVVVPYSNLDNITILEWVFIGDEDTYFDDLDDMFNMEGEEEVTQYMIEDVFSIIGGLDYVLTIPLFKKYYDSRM